ncbi:sensor histidine kinase [Streptomyces boninensis]|uniref:sensor histidine kinase n=1 Tax=Streptomyces boninensis TaxID=2039455 RepID=UPI003B20DCAA
MTSQTWFGWPSGGVSSREGQAHASRPVARVGRLILLALLIGTLFTHEPFQGPGAAIGAVGLVAVLAALRRFTTYTAARQVWPALVMLAFALTLAIAAVAYGARVTGLVVCCVVAVFAIGRLPLAAGLPAMLVPLAAYAVFSDDSAFATAATMGGVALGGYVIRLDADARRRNQRLVEQELAARKAEAETAALDERARIAREIHDVLAHSLSAQLVHLEAARLLIERDGDREQVLERVVAARGMAREGLAETRQALSALRGDIAPVDGYLRELAADPLVEVAVAGEPRALPTEAGQAVRRVAQEALTNVRKHAPGARVRVSFAYGDGEVTLEVRDEGGTRAAGELAASGAGYGLRGMRERAELLGGTLAAGPEGKGFAVKLRVPV